MNKKVQAVVYMEGKEKKNVMRYVKENTEHSSFSAYIMELISKDVPLGVLNEKDNEKKVVVPKNLVLRTRVNESEFIEFEKRIRKEGVSNKSMLLTKIIREYLNDTCHLNDASIKELRLANQNLTAIGRNLNQIVTLIHSGKGNGVQVTDHYMTRMVEYINNQREAVMNVVAFNEGREVLSN